MSCFECTKEHYQFIANALNFAVNYHKTRIGFSEAQKEFWSDSSERQEKMIVLNVNLWQVVNLMAFTERYPHHAEPGDRPDYVTEIGPRDADFSTHKLLKALECVDYQCCDSSRYEGSKEHKLIERLIKDCLIHIAHESEAYKAAPWGIEND